MFSLADNGVRPGAILLLLVIAIFGQLPLRVPFPVELVKFVHGAWSQLLRADGMVSSDGCQRLHLYGSRCSHLWDAQDGVL